MDTSEGPSTSDQDRTTMLYQELAQACRLAEYRLQSLGRERGELRTEHDRLRSDVERNMALMNSSERERSLTLVSCLTKVSS